MADEVRESIEIDAPVQKVWDLVMDPNRLGEWVSTHQAVSNVPDGGLQEGSTFEQRMKLAGKGFDVTWTVKECDAPNKAAWEGAGPGGSTAHVVYALSESDGGTRFDYANGFELPGGALGRVAGRVAGDRAARSQARKTLARLKELLES
jgi:carbon monoxide dehydrogenase subunit G